jgi:DnaJ like chaperone protein
MSIWTRIAEALSALTAGEGLGAVFDRLRTPPERSVAFTIAVIALGAKMAKADGRVTRGEVAAFRQVFTIPPGEEANAARVFDLARTDVAGFEDYARQIKRMFGDDPDHTLWDLLEGLFYIAVSDGEYHEAEDAFLARVAQVFDIDDRRFRCLRMRFVPDYGNDPWTVLGLDPGAPVDVARSAWRQIVKDSHPDRLIARGVPTEAVKLAEARLAAANRAWEEISGKAA